MLAYPALVVGALFLMAGSSCTALVSEKPIFTPDDYDAGGSLVGRYSPVDDGAQVLVRRGPDSQIVILAFEYKRGEKAEDANVLAQQFYLEGAAVPLGNGDYVLQIACAAFIDKTKAYATEIGGKDSPYRAHTSYLTVAWDRKQDYTWLFSDFSYAGDDKEAESLFKQYGLRKDPDKTDSEKPSNYRVRIIPPDITKAAAASLFRDLITLDMNRADHGRLYRRTDRDPQATDLEKQAMVLNDSAECRRVQNEGYSYRKAPAENGPPPPPPPPPPQPK